MFHGVVLLALWKGRSVGGLVDDSVSIGIFAALGFDTLVPEPFVSVLLGVSDALHLHHGKTTSRCNQQVHLHSDEAHDGYRCESASG